jgi:hypothetical protein
MKYSENWCAVSSKSNHLITAIALQAISNVPAIKLDRSGGFCKVVEPLQIQPGKLIDSVQPAAFLFISDATQTCFQLSIQSM